MVWVRVWNRITCRWEGRWMTKAARALLPHLTSIGIGVCIGQVPGWLHPPSGAAASSPPIVSQVAPPSGGIIGGYPPSWQTPLIPSGLDTDYPGFGIPGGGNDLSPDVAGVPTLIIAPVVNTPNTPPQTPPTTVVTTPPRNAPEPASWAILGVAVLGIVCARKAR